MCPAASQRTAQHGVGRRRWPREGVERPYGVAVKHGKRNIYDGHCVSCFATSSPTMHAPNSRTSLHAKERAVTAILRECFPDYNWTFDNIPARCSLARAVGPTRGSHRAIVSSLSRLTRTRTAPTSVPRSASASRALLCKPGKTVAIRFNPERIRIIPARVPLLYGRQQDKEQCMYPKQRGQWERRSTSSSRQSPPSRTPTLSCRPSRTTGPSRSASCFTTTCSQRRRTRVAAGLARGKTIGRRKRKLRNEAEVAEGTAGEALPLLKVPTIVISDVEDSDIDFDDLSQ